MIKPEPIFYECFRGIESFMQIHRADFRKLPVLCISRRWQQLLCFTKNRHLQDTNPEHVQNPPLLLDPLTGL